MRASDLLRRGLLILTVAAACAPPSRKPGAAADAAPDGPRPPSGGDARDSGTAEAGPPPPADAGDAGSEGPAVGPPGGPCTPLDLGPQLPAVLDCTSPPASSRVPELVRQAIGGLGFPPNEGPRRGDLMFVGDQFMAWVDRTGYFGKMNGLWSLNGDPAGLYFTLVEPTLAGSARPVNMLLPGEDGDGRWPIAYSGAEHYEIPRYRGGVHVAQAGLREANHFGSAAPETWRQCINADGSAARWDTELGTNSTEVQADGRVAVSNRAPLAIVARFAADAYPCGSPFPFNDGQPGAMELVQGYVFDPRSGEIERSYQLVNRSPLDYQSQTSVDKLIGGLLLTDWPRPHYLKQFHRFGAWDSDTLTREAAMPYTGAGQTADHIEVRAQGKRWLSATATPVAGRSIRIEQGPGLGDVGHCLCRAHGGFELGGSVLAGLALPGTTQPGAAKASPVHRRRIFLDGERNRPPAIDSHVLQAEEPTDTLHQVGAARGRHWVAEAGGSPGFLYYRKYTPVPAGAVGQAAFVIAIDDVGGPDEPVVRIDLLHNAGAIIASKEIGRGQFRAANVEQRFVLDFESPGPGTIEPRVMWLGRAPTLLDAIVLNWVGADP